MGSIQPKLTDNYESVTTSHIRELRRLIKGGSRLLAPGEDGFQQALVRFSAAAEKPAGAVFLPTNISDISTVVAYASHEHLDIAICGGAHSTAGCSSTDGGLLISLSKMRKATCDPEAQTITAQGGCLWEDVDEASQPHGLATVGGTVHHTGIGGLTLGGGFGWLSYKYGLVVDNLLSMTIVVASGEVLVATPTQNADLFWALCGAGQNFGVVVEFVYQAYPQTDVWAGLLIYTPDKLPQVVEAWNKLEPSMTERDLSGAIVFARPPPAGGKPVVMSVVFHNSNDEAKAKDAFRPLLDVGPIMDTTSLVPYKAVNSMISPPINGCRSSTKGLSFTFPLRPAFVAEQFDAFVAFSDSENEIPGTELSISLWEVVPPAQVAKRDNAATAFSNRGNHFNALVQPMWQRAEDDAVCRQWARDRRVDFQKELERSLGAKEQERERNQAVMFYGNYDQADARSHDVFGSNYPRLQQLKRRYDPGNLFNKLFAIIPTDPAFR